MSNDRDVIVHVFPGKVDERKGEFTNDKGEKVAYETRAQAARLEVNGFAYPYQVRLEKDQSAYAPGRYRMAVEHMLQVNKERHGISKYPVLEPIAATAKTA